MLKTPQNQIVTTPAGDRTYILIFTDDAHSQLGLKQYPPEQANSLNVVAVPPHEAAPELAKLFSPHGVNDVIFNLGGEPLTCELEDLERAVAAAGA